MSGNGSQPEPGLWLSLEQAQIVRGWFETLLELELIPADEDVFVLAARMKVAIS